MAKQAGMGDGFYVHAYNLSGDTNSLGSIHAPSGQFDITGIDKSAMERTYLNQDGEIAWVSYWNAGGSTTAHAALSAPRNRDGDIVQYFRGTTIGNQAAGLRANQIDYAPNRSADGSFVVACQAIASNAAPLEWGEMLTAGVRTDSAATNGASIDYGSVSTAFGLSAYLNVFAVTGTSVTVTLQDSADNSAFANITGATFTAVSGGSSGSERIVTAAGGTIRRYVRAVTTGTFSNAQFAVSFKRYLSATDRPS